MAELTIPLVKLVEIEAGEVGELVHIDTPSGCFNARWLGTVDGESWTLTDACKLMCEIADEEENAK